MPRHNRRGHQLSDPRHREYDDGRGRTYTVKVVSDPNGRHERNGFRYSTVRVYTAKESAR